MFSLPETITVYNVLTDDGFGNKSYSRDEYPARVALHNEQMTDEKGDNFVSKAIVYSDGANLSIESTVYIGQSADLSPPQGSDDVRLFNQTPTGAGALKRVVL